jgi:hypothetical protein
MIHCYVLVHQMLMHRTDSGGCSYEILNVRISVLLSLNLQRGDPVICERKRVVELDRASGEVASQPGAKSHGLIAHRSIERQVHTIKCVTGRKVCPRSIPPLQLPKT